MSYFPRSGPIDRLVTRSFPLLPSISIANGFEEPSDPDVSQEWFKEDSPTSFRPIEVSTRVPTLNMHLARDMLVRDKRVVNVMIRTTQAL